MPRLEWHKAGDRLYESGIDHGVLYIPNRSAIVWNGLISIDESFVGGEFESYYQDGVKYFDSTTGKNFQATISAFSTPPEFDVCIGHKSMIPGFILTRQPREIFSMSYRTQVDGDVGYKIHLIYNATASATKRSYASTSDSVSASDLEWQIDAVPPLSTMHEPSAHYILDSTKLDPYVLIVLEEVLYGTSTTYPDLPDQDELLTIIENH